MYKKDLIPTFQPSEQAKKYTIFVSKQKTRPASDLPLEKQYAFENCMDLMRADHLNHETLQFILDDPALIEAVIAYASTWKLRNEFIELFFFGSLLWTKADTYTFLLGKNIDLVNIRSIHDETPTQFVTRTNTKMPSLTKVFNGH